MLTGIHWQGLDIQGATFDMFLQKVWLQILLPTVLPPHMVLVLASGPQKTRLHVLPIEKFIMGVSREQVKSEAFSWIPCNTEQVCQVRA